MRYALVLAFVFCLCARAALGHGFVGDRFFPPTIATDDPFATDELSLPTVSIFKDPAGGGSPSAWELDSGFEFDKEIFHRFALGLSDDYIYQKPQDEHAVGGWDNDSLSAKYQFWQNDEHEAVMAIGLITDFGGSGSSNVGVDRFNTYTPTFYFGKGFGDLPDSLWAMQPLAVTGTLAQSFPASSDDANQFQWGFAVEYSLPYLQQHVKDVGIPAPFKNMIPLVEFALSTDENRAARGQTTGTINPGVLWETPYYQLGMEAIIPVNGHTGPSVGATVQLQIFIDDIFPTIFGHPLFFGDPS